MGLSIIIIGILQKKKLLILLFTRQLMLNSMKLWEEQKHLVQNILQIV